MKYEITIRATIIKTYVVDADDGDEAVEKANELFSVLTDDAEEHYTQEVLDIVEVKESK